MEAIAERELEESTDELIKTEESQRTRCEVWTRVMGYHRPTSHFNIGKKAEHFSRKHFLECASANSKFCKRYAA